MSTKKTPYGEKVKRSERMYGPCPKIPEWPNHLDGPSLRRKYGDNTPMVIAERDRFGEPVWKHRSET